MAVLLHRSKDALLIFQGQFYSGYRRFKVRHHETTTEPRVCVDQHGCCCRTISTMMVEVVGGGDSNGFVGHGCLFDNYLCDVRLYLLTKGLLSDI